MLISFPKIEKRILKFWRENRIFEKSIEQRKKAPNFVFYEGPPTANAAPGLHHVLARVYKDIICRYKTMRGFKVLRKAGWDTHGLPVELEIEKKLGLKSKKEIEKYGIAKFNQKCQESVWEYKKDWEKLTERIAFWLDMKNPYITYQPEYIETVWWIIKQIYQKGLLYKDYKVVPYCARCGTSLSTHEVALGYEKIKEPAIYVKFEILNPKFETKGKIYLLVWTTTPWTLPGNVAIAINPEFTYSEVKIDEEYLILAKERLSALEENYQLIREFKGRDLVDLRYEPLYPREEILKIAYKVLPADFVSLKEGTGLVHIAPAFGEEDMGLIKIQKDKFPILVNVNEEGRFTLDVKKWAGLYVKDADPLIIEDLRNRDLLFKEELYEHDYPFCWRCDSPLLYYAKQGWFINMQKVKKDLIKNNQKINWIPAHLKKGRFGEWLREIKDWALSRERYWGTPLPVWHCQTGKSEIRNLYSSRWPYLGRCPNGAFSLDEPNRPKSETARSVPDGSRTNPKFQIQNSKRCDNIIVIGSKEDLISQKFSTNNYFIFRHGHSLRQTKKLAMCWPEKIHCSLTEEGKIQVQNSAKKLKNKKIDLIFSSDLLRTKETTQILAEEIGLQPTGHPTRKNHRHPPATLKIIFDKRLREYNVGIFNGRDPELVWEYIRKKENFIEAKPPKGESLMKIANRMYGFLKEIDKKYQGRNILIVSHELPLIILEKILKGWSLEKILEWRNVIKGKTIETGEFRKIEFRNLPLNEKMELDFHRSYVDEVKFFCPKCKGLMERVPEVIDCWFDSGSMPFAQGHWPFAQNKKSKIKNKKLRPPELFPADYISEAVDQTRGWFYTLLAISTLLGFGAPYKNVISLGHVLDEKGEKMSKSKGNVVEPRQILEKYSADATRWYFFTVNQPGDAKLFSEKGVEEALKRFIIMFWNCALFSQTYGQHFLRSSESLTKRKNILDYNPPTTQQGNVLDYNPPTTQQGNVLDRWVISKLTKLIQEVTENLEKYDVTLAARAIENFVINDLSQWYIRRSRKRFHPAVEHPEAEQVRYGARSSLRGKEARKDFEEASQTLAHLLLTLSKLAAPFIPFLSEKIYHYLKWQFKQSVHLEDWPRVNKNLINKKLEKKMEKVREVVASALAERAKAGIKVRQPLSELRITNYDLRKEKELLELIKEEVNVKEITFGKTLKLETRITLELKEEGMIREVIRNIQEMRKIAKLKPKDKVLVRYLGTANLNEILTKNKNFILKEAKVKDLILGLQPHHRPPVPFGGPSGPLEKPKEIFDAEKEIMVDQQNLWLAIKKI